jgi:GT2 family glycosyltransferase
MMVKKELFINIGMYDEVYEDCWEDVDVNLKIKLRGFDNIINGNCVAYHLESKTRDIDSNQNIIVSQYNNVLIPKIKENFNKLKNNIYYM